MEGDIPPVDGLDGGVGEVLGGDAGVVVGIVLTDQQQVNVGVFVVVIAPAAGAEQYRGLGPFPVVHRLGDGNGAGVCVGAGHNVASRLF